MTLPSDELLERSRRALAAGREDRRVADDRPVVGSLLVLGAPDLPVEWLLVEEHEDGFWALVVDSAPWVGTSDLRLEQTPECPRGVVRGRVGLQLGRSSLANHAGGPRLHPRDLQRLVQHRQASGDASSEASSRQLETDWEPAYRDWLATLFAERDRLATERLAEDDTPGTPGAADPRSAIRPLAGAWRTWQMAAAILLSAALAWTVGRRTAEKDIAALRQALDIAQGAARVAEGPQVNLPIAWLRARAIERGDVDVMTLEPDADWVLFIIEAPDGAATYQLTLLDAESSPVTSVRGLRPSVTGELSLALPAAAFETGLYRALILSEPDEASSTDELELWFRVQAPAP